MQDAPVSLLRSLASLFFYALGGLGIWFLAEAFEPAGADLVIILMGLGGLLSAVFGLLLLEALNRHERHMRGIVVALQDLHPERVDHEAAAALPPEQ